MKKIIIAAAALVAMTACNKNLIEVSNPEAGYGYINLGVTADTELVVTKTGDVDKSNYQVSLYNSEGTLQETRAYSEILENGWKVVAGSYKFKVENILEANIYNKEVNNAKGQLYIAGESDEAFEVHAGLTTEQTVDCSVKNAKVSFQYTEAFIEVFPEYVLNVASASKSFPLSMLQAGADRNTLESAFFAPGAVTWTLNATRQDQEVKLYTSSFDAAPASWTIVTFSVGSTGSTIKVTINVNDTIVEEQINAELDPMEGGVTITKPEA